MKISGLMKLTLLDYPGHVACTVFLAGCNFRCPFCHNGSLVRGGDTEISRDELKSFLKKRQGVLDGVCITGGEPLLSPDARELAEEIKSLGYLVKLDTNGSFPDRLAELIDKKLIDYVAMDIKSSPAEYAKTCGRDIDLDSVKRSIEIIKSSGIDHEFRTTVVKGLHNKEIIAECAALVGEGEKYFLQSYRESEDILAPDGLSALSNEELAEILNAAKLHNSRTELRGV